MSVLVKRSCNSSNRIDDDRVIFNSFIIYMTDMQSDRFKAIHKYLHDDNGFDRVLMARTLEEIIDTGLAHLSNLTEVKNDV